MNSIEKEKVAKVVTAFAKTIDYQDSESVNKFIDELSTLDIDTAIDDILISLDNLVDDKKLGVSDIYAQEDLLVNLNQDKYHNMNDLLRRLGFIKEMNIAYSKMPLSLNHQLILETFDAFNGLIGEEFDCYYTGGLMGYLATGQKLERYHSDLDLFINEEQLLSLKKIVDESSDFTFVSNMKHKEKHGHEYKITYKDTPMSIGLFLFERDYDNSIITKEYYYENGELLVDKGYSTEEYTRLCCQNQIKSYDGYNYKMVSLENIYNLKKNARPKDRYDAKKIKDSVNLDIDKRLDEIKKYNYQTFANPADNTIIQDVEATLTSSIKSSK